MKTVLNIINYSESRKIVVSLVAEMTLVLKCITYNTHNVICLQILKTGSYFFW